MFRRLYRTQKTRMEQISTGEYDSISVSIHSIRGISVPSLRPVIIDRIVDPIIFISKICRFKIWLVNFR